MIQPVPGPFVEDGDVDLLPLKVTLLDDGSDLWLGPRAAVYCKVFDFTAGKMLYEGRGVVKNTDCGIVDIPSFVKWQIRHRGKGHTFTVDFEIRWPEREATRHQ